MKEKKSTKQPWPTKAVMEQIYEKKLWGGGSKIFYSGFGSHHPDLVVPYLQAVRGFLSSFEQPLIVCDLGCGDFNIGKELLPYAAHFHAVDIVSDLITYHKQHFQYERLTFHCLDLAKDELPKGDVAIVRQVLQHLSNKEVSAIVEKLQAYKYIILTEHLPEGNFTANKDIITGQGIRLKKQSGIDLLSPPFNLKVKTAKVLSVLKSEEFEGEIRTVLFTSI